MTTSLTAKDHEVNERCKRWPSVPVIKVLTNGTIVIFKKNLSHMTCAAMKNDAETIGT